jgi:RNA polymerase sigma-70 factor, ECF subfamily
MLVSGARHNHTEWGEHSEGNLDNRRPVEVQNRTHFVALASRLTGKILADYARSRNAAERDGGSRVSLSGGLGIMDERQARIVELKFFGGLSSSAEATELGVS